MPTFLAWIFFSENQGSATLVQIFSAPFCIDVLFSPCLQVKFFAGRKQVQPTFALYIWSVPSFQSYYWRTRRFRGMLSHFAVNCVHIHKAFSRTFFAFLSKI